jgi:hypothetical protein
MATTYDYAYDYEAKDSNPNQRTNPGASGRNTNAGNYTQRSTGHQQPRTGVPGSTFNRSSNADPLTNLQHDRIWNKLYDPLSMDKTTHGTEIQVC